MDANRFDALVRSLTAPRSRRGALATLLAGLLGPLVGDDAAGKRSRGKSRGGDARLQVADAATPDAWWDDTPFDAVLLDAPCTATGVIRRARVSRMTDCGRRSPICVSSTWTVTASRSPSSTVPPCSACRSRMPS